MLGKKNRLTKKKDFEKVFKEGKGFKEGSLILKIVPGENENRRFGVIISKKISKKAAVRNKIKRRIRAVIKTKISKIKKGLDAVFLGLPGLEEKNFKETERLMETLFKKAKLTKND